MLKLPIKIFNTVLFILVINLSAAYADGSWHTRGAISIKSLSIKELNLPPELILSPSPGKMDLSLHGPDGKKRAFELFMHTKPISDQFELVPKMVSLTKNDAFSWQSESINRYINKVSLEIKEPAFVGTVQIYSLNGKNWEQIVKDEAVYKTNNSSKNEIKLPLKKYKALKFIFSGFNKKYKKRAFPIQKITSFSNTSGTKLSEEKQKISFKKYKIEKGFEFKTSLKGSGLYIKNIEIKTEAPFMGKWQLGSEEIKNGQEIFNLISNGKITGLNSENSSVFISLNRRWAGTSFIIRLYNEERFIGKIKNATITYLAPRLRFLPDKKGLYSLITGSGNLKKIKEFANHQGPEEKEVLRVSDIKMNPEEKISSIAASYNIKGGPFNEKDYKYKASIHIPAPGYYRLKLHIDAALDKNRESIRIVRNKTQIPFILSSKNIKETEISPEPSYNEEKNMTTWALKFPEKSTFWHSFTLYSKGIFERDVIFSIKKQGNSGWRIWKKKHWVNKNLDSTSLNINLDKDFNEKQEILIQISHYDNQPIVLNKVLIYYSAQDLLFPASEAGDYFVYGGNNKKKEPSFDLNLIRDKLLKSLPEDIKMPKPKLLKEFGAKKFFHKLFIDNSIGLYLVIGFVTFILIGIVVKIFPENKTNENS